MIPIDKNDEALKMWMDSDPSMGNHKPNEVFWESNKDKDVTHKYVNVDFSENLVMDANNIPNTSDFVITKSGESPNPETLSEQIKQLEEDVQTLDHKIKQFVNHLRYTRRYKTRAIKKAIVKQFGKQINEIDARSNNLENQQKEQVQPSTDRSNEDIQGQEITT